MLPPSMNFIGPSSRPTELLQFLTEFTLRRDLAFDLDLGVMSRDATCSQSEISFLTLRTLT